MFSRFFATMLRVRFKQRVAFVFYLTLGVSFAAKTHADELTDWKVVKSDNVELFTDYNSKTAYDVAEKFEIFRLALLQLLKADSDIKLPPLKIYLFKSNKMWQQLPHSKNKAGYFENQIYGPRMLVSPFNGKPDLTTLFHEYVHFLVSATVPIRYAEWYNEGIADFFSTMVIEDDFVYIGKIPEGRAKSLSTRGLLKLEELFAARNVFFENNLFNEKFYASAWLTTHYFTLGARNGFPSYYANNNKFLLLKSQGKDSQSAFEESFDISMSDLNSELRRYARGNKKEGIILDKPGLANKPSVTALSSVQAQSVLAPVFGWRDRDGIGTQFLLAAAEKGDPFAQSIRAIQLASSNDHEQSAAILQSLDKVSQYNPNTLYNMGFAYKRLAMHAKKRNDKDNFARFTDQAKLFFDKSIADEPYLPALIELVSYQLNFGSKQAANDAVNTLIRFAPSHLAARITAARAYISLGQNQLAKENLDSALGLAHHNINAYSQIKVLRDSID